MIGAAQVFDRDGYAAATTDSIAERAGVSVGSLYQYYPNKDAIVVALGYCHLLDAATDFLPLVERLSAEPPLAIQVAIEKLVEVCRRPHEQHPRLHRILFEEMPVDGGVAELLGSDGGPLIDLLAEFFERAPDCSARNPRLAAILVLQTLVNATHQFATAPAKGFSEEDCASELAHMLRAYLTT